MTTVADPTVTGAPEAAADDTAAKAAAEQEIQTELAKFNDVVSDAISDGTPNDDQIKAVRIAYGKLEPRRGKLLARQALDDDIRESIQNGNLIQAQGLFALKDAVLKGALKAGGTRAPSKPKNVTAALVERVLAIQLGYSLAVTNAPADADPNWRDQVKADAELERAAQAYRAWIEAGSKGEAPDVPAVAASGARISLGRGPKGQGRKPKKDGAEAEGGTASAATPVGVPEGWEA